MPEMVKFCCRRRKNRFSMETGRFWAICLFGARNGKICPDFLLFCYRLRKKAVFQWKRAVAGPFASFGPEMVKFAPIFCYCALCCKPRKGRFSIGNGPFLAHLLFWGPKWSNLPRIFMLCANFDLFSSNWSSFDQNYFIPTIFD